MHRDWRALKENKKKRKWEQVEQYLKNKEQVDSVNTEDTEKSTKKKCKNSFAIAVPGSILNKVQSAELKTYVAGQIARAACIYKTDEVVIFCDIPDDRTWHNCELLAQILKYLECPQYLRRYLFPISEDLKYAGLLNPLGAPHHVKLEDLCTYREGIVLEEQHKSGLPLADVGLKDKLVIDQNLEAGTRVTVKLPMAPKKGVVVSSLEPRSLGMYWGYKVRLASNLTKIFTECPHKKGYNLKLGTSDRGVNIGDVEFNTRKRTRTIVVFGGPAGLEKAADLDESLSVKDVNQLFDHYVNTCPGQGSKTIRTEEAVLISLALITDKIKWGNVPQELTNPL